MAEQRSRPGDESQAAAGAFGGAENQDTGSDAGVFFRNSYAVLVRGRSVRRHLEPTTLALGDGSEPHGGVR